MYYKVKLKKEVLDSDTAVILSPDIPKGVNCEIISYKESDGTCYIKITNEKDISKSIGFVSEITKKEYTDSRLIEYKDSRQKEDIR